MKNIALALAVLTLYLFQNISKNMLVNFLSVNNILATFLTAIFFGSFIVFLTHKENFLKKINFQFQAATITILLALINLYPFNIKLSADFFDIFIQMCFVATAEEIIFRGYLFRFIDERKGTKAAIIISSAIFGFVHAVNILNDDFRFVLMQILYATFIGIVYACIQCRTKSLIPCIISHAIINIAGNLGAESSIIKELLFTFVCFISAIYIFHHHRKDFCQ